VGSSRAHAKRHCDRRVAILSLLPIQGLCGHPPAPTTAVTGDRAARAKAPGPRAAG